MVQNNRPINEILNFVNEAAYKANAYSDDLVSLNRTQNAIKLLQNIEKLLKKYNSHAMLANVANLTYNNLASIHKKTGNSQLAFSYLEIAIQICIDHKKTDNLAITYLNACILLDELSDHVKSLEFAKKAAVQCQNELRKLEPVKLEQKNEKNSLLVLSYYKMGIQEEAISDLKTAIKWYNKALEILNHNPKCDQSLKPKIETAKNKAQSQLDLTITEKQKMHETNKFDLNIILPPFSPKNEDFISKKSSRIRPQSGIPKSIRPKEKIIILNSGTPTRRNEHIQLKNAWGLKSRHYSTMDERDFSKPSNLIERLKTELTHELKSNSRKTSQSGLSYTKSIQNSDFEEKSTEKHEDESEICELQKIGLCNFETEEKQKTVIYFSKKENMLKSQYSYKEITEIKDFTNEESSKNSENSMHSQKSARNRIIQNSPIFVRNPAQNLTNNLSNEESKIHCKMVQNRNKKKLKLKALRTSDLNIDVVNINIPLTTKTEKINMQKIPEFAPSPIHNIDSYQIKPTIPDSMQTTLILDRNSPRDHLISFCANDEDYEKGGKSLFSIPTHKGMTPAQAVTKITKIYRGHLVRNYYKLLKLRNSQRKLICRSVYKNTVKAQTKFGILCLFVNIKKNTAEVAYYDLRTHKMELRRNSTILSETLNIEKLCEQWNKHIQENKHNNISIEELCNKFVEIIQTKTAKPRKIPSSTFNNCYGDLSCFNENLIKHEENNDNFPGEDPTMKDVAIFLDENDNSAISNRTHMKNINETGKIETVKAEEKKQEENSILEPLAEKARLSTVCETGEMPENVTFNDCSLVLQPLNETQGEQCETSDARIMSGLNETPKIKGECANTNRCISKEDSSVLPLTDKQIKAENEKCEEMKVFDWESNSTVSPLFSSKVEEYKKNNERGKNNEICENSDSSDTEIFPLSAKY